MKRCKVFKPVVVHTEHQNDMITYPFLDLVEALEEECKNLYNGKKKDIRESVDLRYRKA